MGLGSMEYVPTLKAREAEIKAVLKAPTTLQLTPLFELQRTSAAAVNATTGDRKRAKSAVTDASYFLDDIARLWANPLYVDISRVSDAARRPAWWRLLDSVNSLNATPALLVPVLIPTDSTAVHAAARGVAAHTGRAALRVSMMNLKNAATIATATKAIATNLGISTSSVDVIMDWADAMEPMSISLDDLAKATSDVITALGTQHGRLITIGTPKTDAFQQVGDWKADRREWLLWLRLAHAARDATYGDYALYPPADPVPAAPRYGHLRYSSGNQLHVHRRAIPSTGGGLGAAFRTCCEYLITQKHWMGPGFSKADQRLHDIATGSDKESQAGAWRQLAVEHHFAVVAQQLSNPPVAPPPGTP